MAGCVYILTNYQKTVLYTGVTADLERRIAEHKNGVGSAFTQRYKVYYLVYVEEYLDIRDAIAREKTIKRWVRAWKDQLITGMNPDWFDLTTNKPIGE